MKIQAIKQLLILTALGCSTALFAQPHTDNSSLKIMTYNVRNGMGEDGQTDYDRVADVIKKSGAQFIAIQELDSVTHRSNGHYVLEELAQRTGLYPTFGAAIPFSGGKYRIGILSLQKPLSITQKALPGREEKRTLLIAEFDRFVLGCVHLSLTAKDQLKSLKPIMEEAQKWNKPFFLAGDWNALPDSKFLKKIRKKFLLVNNPEWMTYPAGKPVECLDYIALYKNGTESLEKQMVYVINAPEASDHRPVMSVLKLKP